MMQSGFSAENANFPEAALLSSDLLTLRGVPIKDFFGRFVCDEALNASESLEKDFVACSGDGVLGDAGECRGVVADIFRCSTPPSPALNRDDSLGAPATSIFARTVRGLLKRAK